MLPLAGFRVNASFFSNLSFISYGARTRVASFLVVFFDFVVYECTGYGFMFFGVE